MIPWFVVSIIGAIASLFGRDVYVRALSGAWGAERLYFVRRPPGSQRPRRLKACRGGPVSIGERLPCPCDAPLCPYTIKAAFGRPG